MTLMSLTEALAAMPLPAVADVLMQQWLDAAEERISAVHGSIGGNQQAEYRWIDLSTELQLTQQASALVSVEADGGSVEAVLSAGGWGVQRADGRRYWSALVIEVVYTPEERMVTRKEMQRQLVLGYAATNGYSQQTFGGAMVRPDREYEDRALALLPLPWLITDNYPTTVSPHMGGG